MTKIGITGHQRLNDSGAWSWVEGTMRDEVSKLMPPLIAVTSLAVGADQLLARVVLENGGTIHAVLPFADVERSFSHKELPSFQQLKKRATTIEVLNTPGTDEDGYLAAGHRVVDLSDVVIAVWDGKPAKGKGGTADVVAYISKRGVPFVQINPDLRTVEFRSGSF